MQRNHLILAATLVAVVGALAWRSRGANAGSEALPLATSELSAPDRADPPTSGPPEPIAASSNHSDSEAPAEVAKPLPRLLELGSDSCASCRAMIPVLAELREGHAGELDVDFIDVWKFPERAKPYGVRVIPTQIFLAPDGSELARHQGFYAAAAIRERWGELGFQLESETQAP